jgi:hypothetical protein
LGAQGHSPLQAQSTNNRSQGKMEKTIYMPLIGEGTDCWRPVRALKLEDEVFEVADAIPEDESWAFAPFARVRCEEKVFADGRKGLVVLGYAIETHPYYRLLKDHEGQVFRIVLTDGEEAIVKITHVDGQHEDFIFDLLSTNLDTKYRGMPANAAYAAKFADLISARLEQ